MRKSVVVLGIQTDAIQQVLHASLQLRAAGDAVQFHRAPDDLTDPLARIERRERILEDRLHLAPYRAQVTP